MEKSGMGMAGLTFLSYPTLSGQETTDEHLKLGIASYTFRNYSLEQSLKMSVRLNIKRMTLKSMHLPLESTDEEIHKAIDLCKAAGVEIYGAGVIYMNNKDEVDNAFRYARAAGLEMIVGVPLHELLEYVESHVKKTGIKVAIHNHGPGDKVYPTPQSIYDKVSKLDTRIGMCLDIGHTARMGLNPAEEAARYMDRIFDLHIKDATSATADGDTVEMGRGVIDLPGFFQQVIRSKFAGTASFEYEKDENDVMPGLAECVGYVRGILSMIKTK
jgi:sugar phosphate isomerase/epimerase